MCTWAQQKNTLPEDGRGHGKEHDTVVTVKRTLVGALISGFGAVATLWLAALGPGAASARADVRCDPVCHGTLPGRPS